MFVKTLSGDLYEIDDVKNDNKDIEDKMILEQLYDRYPDVFPRSRTTIVDVDEMVHVIISPPRVTIKKKYKRDNSNTLCLELNFKECIRNVRFYNGDPYDIGGEHENFHENYETYLKWYNRFPSPNTAGLDSNCIDIVNHSSDYLCIIGHMGTTIKGNDLRKVLSSQYTQLVPYYRIKFYFKPEIIEEILTIAKENL